MGRSSEAYAARQEREDAIREASEDLLQALRQAQAALAMFVSPEKIVVTSVAGAWATAVRAECLARAAIAKAEGRS